MVGTISLVYGDLREGGATGALVPPLLLPSAFWTALNWDDRLLCSWTYWATLKISPPTSKLALWSLVLCKKFSSEGKFYICMQCTTFRICFDCRLNLASGLQVGQTVKFYFCTGKGKTIVQKEWINDHHQWIYTAIFVLVLYCTCMKVKLVLPCLAPLCGYCHIHTCSLTVAYAVSENVYLHAFSTYLLWYTLVTYTWIWKLDDQTAWYQCTQSLKLSGIDWNDNFDVVVCKECLENFFAWI